MGLQLKKYPDLPLDARMKSIKYFKINKILDIWANIGQYAQSMREQGFLGEIISFEPLHNAFEYLKSQARKDHKWIVYNMAIGNIDWAAIINVAKNSQSSSVLEMLPLHLKVAPDSVFIGTENIVMRKLDTIIDEFYQEGDNILLKIDAQWYEKNILEGATRAIKNIRWIKLEMSIVPLYKWETLFEDMIKYVQSKDFILYSLEYTYSDAQTGQLLQVDGTFYKR